MTGRSILLGLPVAFALAGCADTPPAPPPAQADSVAPAVPVMIVDGVFEGQRTPDLGNPGCGFEASIGFNVAGGSIRLRTSKERRELSGAIDSTGHFTMLDVRGNPTISGQINGNTLTAVESVPPHHHRHDGNVSVAGGTCTAHITATRSNVAP